MEKKEYTGTRSRSSGGFIWEMMEGSWKYFWGCVAAMTGGVAFSFLSPALVGFIIDSVIGTEPIDLPGPLTAYVENLGESMGSVPITESSICPGPSLLMWKTWAGGSGFLTT